MYCGYPVKTVEEYTFDEFFEGTKEDVEKRRMEVFQKHVLPDTSFDESVYLKRINEEDARERASNTRIASQVVSAEQPTQPRCPTCNSTDIKKIGGVDRAFSVAFWGLASSKIGKTFKCNHCGYTW